MPDLANRDKHEKRLEAAFIPIFRRWRREFEKAGQTFPVTITDDEQATVRQALGGPFNQAATSLADQVEMPLDESMNTMANLFVTNFAGELCDAVVDSTNRWIQRIEADEREKELAESGEKSFKGAAKAAFSKIKDLVLSAKRAATIAITETTRMATAGERMVASVWNRLFGRKKADQETVVVDAGEQVVKPADVVDVAAIELVARWYTSGDDRVCPLCGPLDGLFQDKWPQYAKAGSPIHVKCRCWLEWEKRQMGAKS